MKGEPKKSTQIQFMWVLHLFDEKRKKKKITIFFKNFFFLTQSKYKNQINLLQVAPWTDFLTS